MFYLAPFWMLLVHVCACPGPVVRTRRLAQWDEELLVCDEITRKIPKLCSINGERRHGCHYQFTDRSRNADKGKFRLRTSQNVGKQSGPTGIVDAFCSSLLPRCGRWGKGENDIISPVSGWLELHANPCSFRPEFATASL